MCARTHKDHIVPLVVFVLAACERCAQRAHCVRAPCALALCLPYCPQSIQLCLCVRAHTKATSCRGRVRARSLRALCSEGALCTGALCAGAVPAVLPSEHSIVFMCARTHKGHIVPMVVFVLAACERGPRRPQGCVASDETRLFLLKPLSGRRHASAAWRASSQSRLLPRTRQPA